MDISIVYKGTNELFRDTLEKICQSCQYCFVHSSDISQYPSDNIENYIVFSDPERIAGKDITCEILVLPHNSNYTIPDELSPLDIVHDNCPARILLNKINLYRNNLAKCCQSGQNYKAAVIMAAKEKIIIERFRRISSISRKVNSLDLDEIARACVEDIPDIFHAKYASIYTYDSENQCLHLMRHNHDHKISSLVNINSNPDRPMSQAVKGKKLMIIEDLDIHKFADASGQNQTNYQTRSCVVAPLLSGDKILGILNLADKYDLSNFEKQTDLPALELLCETIGAALCNIELYKEVNHKAQTDGMTGLVNHTTFYNILKRELNRSERYGGKLALLMIDLDGLKGINDKHGHLAGDLVIKHIADCIRKCIRQTDIAARYGGDEFAIILPETNIYDAEIIADRLLDEVESNLVHFKDANIRATISIGLGQSENGKPIEELVDDIDSALFTAKENGKNQRILA